MLMMMMISLVGGVLMSLVCLGQTDLKSLMMRLILYSSTMISGLIFFQMNHPVAMVLMLLMQTLQICLLTELMTKSFWFSYILILIVPGGMLVLFIYFMLFYISTYLQNHEVQPIYNFNLFMMENSLNLNKLYNYPTNLITILLMNYLLITLIAVVKTTKLFYGPLRLMN